MSDDRSVDSPAQSSTSSAVQSSPEYRAHLARLVRRLSEAEGALSALTAGQIDAVLDPSTAAPILLTRTQEVLARSEARYPSRSARKPSALTGAGRGANSTTA